MSRRISFPSFMRIPGPIGILTVGMIVLCGTVPAAAKSTWQVEGEPAVAEQHVSFENAGARLQGTLYEPRTGTQLPAVVVLWGAAMPTRKFMLYRHLTQGLAAMGIAVLVFDRRGNGASTGTMHGTDYRLLADDAVAAARSLARKARIDPHKIGYWGLSQGGWLAMLAASRDKHAAFAVSVSAPLVTPAEQMDFAVTNLLTVHGYKDTDVAQAIDVRHVWEGFLRGRIPCKTALAAIKRVQARPWFDLEFMPDADEFAHEPVNKAWKRDMDYDPIRIAERLTVPTLLIYGGADPWIPVARSIQRLRPLAERHPNIAYRVIANANHTMMLPDKDTMAFDRQSLLSEAPQAPAYFMVLASWIERQIHNAKPVRRFVAPGLTTGDTP